MHNADMFEVFERLRKKRQKEIDAAIEDALNSGMLEHEVYTSLNEIVSAK